MKMYLTRIQVEPKQQIITVSSHHGRWHVYGRLCEQQTVNRRPVNGKFEFFSSLPPTQYIGTPVKESRHCLFFDKKAPALNLANFKL